MAEGQDRTDGIWNKTVSHWICGKTSSHEDSWVVDWAALWVHAVSICGGFWHPAGWLGSSWGPSKPKLFYNCMKGSSFTLSLRGKLKDILHQCQTFSSEAWVVAPVINISTQSAWVGVTSQEPSYMAVVLAAQGSSFWCALLTSLVMIFILKLQMEILCQKWALPLIHYNILAQSSLCQAVTAKHFLTHALYDSPFRTSKLLVF